MHARQGMCWTLEYCFCIDSEQRCHSKDFEWTCKLFPSMIICCEEKNNLLAKAKTVKKPSEHWGGAIDQFASDFTPYIWECQTELSPGLVQLWSNRLKGMSLCGDQQAQEHSNNFAQECLPKMLPCRVECLVGLTSATSLQPSSTDHCVYDGPRHKSFQSKWRVAVM